MSGLDDIPIRVEPGTVSPRTYGNALPILSEIRHALARLADGGEPTRIDLAAMPFGPGDEARLMDLLGRGEVSATIDALGPTRIHETRFPGVWVVEYTNTDSQRMALQIEVDETPLILRTPRADLPDSLAALDACIADAAPAMPGAPGIPDS